MLDWKKNIPGNKPDPFVPIMVYIPSADPLPTVAEAYMDPDGFFHPHRFLGEIFTDEVTHWADMPKPPTDEAETTDPTPNEGVNTKIIYIHRDDCNFKAQLEEVVKGTMTADEKDILFSWLKWKASAENTGKSWDEFYPWKLGFADLSDPDDPDDYHELVDILPTKNEPTVDMTVQEFVELLKSGETKE